MSTRKETLTFITDDAERKEVFEIKKKQLIKKVSEISRIYGVDACAIIYNPFEPDEEPVVWPSKIGAQAVLTRFRNLPESERVKHMVNFFPGGPGKSETPLLEAAAKEQEAPLTDDEE